VIEIELAADDGLISEAGAAGAAALAADAEAKIFFDTLSYAMSLTGMLSTLTNGAACPWAGAVRADRAEAGNNGTRLEMIAVNSRMALRLCRTLGGIGVNIEISRNQACGSQCYSILRMLKRNK